MKRNILESAAVFAILVSLLVLNTGCEDKLNALPGEKKVYDFSVVDEPTAQIALNGVYYRFANSGESADEPLTTQWARPHEHYAASAAGLGMYPYGPGYFEEPSQISGASTALIWSYYYTLINAANGVIEQVSAVADSKFADKRKAGIIAEARWMRAYGHLMLLSWFGQFWDTGSDYGVIVREEFVTVNNLSLPRSSVAATYASILADIDYAIANAPDQNPNQYVNKWVAMALKARALIMRGEASDYGEVVRITDDIIARGPYKLEENLKDIFFDKGLESGEVMLGVCPYDNQAGHRKAYLDTYNRPGIVATTAMEELLADDPRREWMIGTFSVNAYIYTFAPDGTSTMTLGLRYGIGKYMGAKGETAYCLRLAEIYLLNAEALLRGGGSVDAARARIRTVKEKAGVTDFAALDAIADRDAMLRALWDEWAMNLAYEDGQEWFALMRFPLSVIGQIKPNMTSENQRIIPIPTGEFEKNHAIRGMQNPGWSEN